MESSFMTTVVFLLPVQGGSDGTRLPNGSRTRAAAPIATTTKNAGAAGTPGYPSWSHPV